MTAPTTTSPASAPDTRRLPPLTFARTAAVEARKLINTRSGVTLVAVAGLLAGVFAGGRALFPSEDTNLGELAGMAAIPATWLLMVMAILLVTGEFARPAASITFILDPNRGRVLAAKATVVVGLALTATALSLLAGLLVAAVAPAITGQVIPLTIDTTWTAVLTGTAVFTALAGFAWALALRNAPAPIVVLLLWPTVELLISALSDSAATALTWVSLVEPVFALSTGAEHAWLKLATSTLAWIIVPGGLGTWRLLSHDL